MLGISRLCASSLGSKSLYSRLPTQFNNVFTQSNQISRRIITSNHHTLKCGNYVKNYTVNTSRVQFKLSQTFKNASLIVARSLSSNAEVKKETSKAVGYWLLTCSGMVFVAVVLGTLTGYLVLLYSIYYVMDLIVSTTKNK